MDASDILDILLDDAVEDPGASLHSLPEAPVKVEAASAATSQARAKCPLAQTLASTVAQPPASASQGLWSSLLRGELEVFLSGKVQQRPIVLQSICSGWPVKFTASRTCRLSAPSLKVDVNSPKVFWNLTAVPKFGLKTVRVVASRLEPGHAFLKMLFFWRAGSRTPCSSPCEGACLDGRHHRSCLRLQAQCSTIPRPELQC